MRISLFPILAFLLMMRPAIAGTGAEPADRALLHHNTVYLKDALVTGGAEYELRVYPDTLTEQPEIRSRKGIPAFTLSNLGWNRHYYWRVDVYDRTNKLIQKGVFRRFTIRGIQSLFFDDIKVNVLNYQSRSSAGGLVAVDVLRTIVDRNGNPVWTLPNIRAVVNDSSRITDLCVTPDNTITFFTERSGFEIDLHGNLLWRLPERFVLKGDTVRFYGKLYKNSKGNYYVSGSKKVYRKLQMPEGMNAGNSRGIKLINNEPHRRTETGLVMEFDKKGKLLWYWDANAVLSDAMLNHVKREGQMPRLISDLSAFAFNAKEDEFFVSFRALNMVLKVSKKTGQVLKVYGNTFDASKKSYAAHLLNHPADVDAASDGTLLVFNTNGDADQRKASEILILKPDSVPGETILSWRFALDFDTLSDGRSIKSGNVEETDKGTLFVGGGTTSRIFELDKQGNILWDAFVYTKTRRDTGWKKTMLQNCRQTQELTWHHVFVQPMSLAEGKLKLALNNTGNVADSYQVRIYDKKKQLLYEGRSEVIQSNAKTVLTVPLKTNLPRKEMIAKVTSLASGITEETLIPGSVTE